MSQFGKEFTVLASAARSDTESKSAVFKAETDGDCGGRPADGFVIEFDINYAGTTDYLDLKIYPCIDGVNAALTPSFIRRTISGANPDPDRHVIHIYDVPAFLVGVVCSGGTNGHVVGVTARGFRRNR